MLIEPTAATALARPELRVRLTGGWSAAVPIASTSTRSSSGEEANARTIALVVEGGSGGDLRGWNGRIICQLLPAAPPHRPCAQVRPAR